MSIPIQLPRIEKKIDSGIRKPSEVAFLLTDPHVAWVLQAPHLSRLGMKVKGFWAIEWPQVLFFAGQRWPYIRKELIERNQMIYRSPRSDFSTTIWWTGELTRIKWILEAMELQKWKVKLSKTVPPASQAEIYHSMKGRSTRNPMLALREATHHRKPYQQHPPACKPK